MAGWMIIIFLPSLLWFFQLLFVMWNVTQWRPLPPPEPASQETAHQPGVVSVLIPARNEAHRIEACIHAVYRQSNAQFEVIVLNDQSTDETEKVLQKLKGQYPQLRVLQGLALPTGWYGKPHACHQLAQHARGDWLLFLDADTRIHPDTITRLRYAAKVEGAALISGFGRLTGPSASSLILTSLMTFVISMHLPIRLVMSSRDTRFVAANGALIFISRTVYERIGGHDSQRLELVEDMALGRAVKRIGEKVWMANLSDTLTTAMYDSFADAWRGYRKNIFPGLGYSYLAALFVIIYYTFMFILPVLIFVAAVLTSRHTIGYSHPGWFTQSGFSAQVGSPLWLIISSVWSLLAALAAKALVDKRFAVPWWISLLVPISAVGLIAILAASSLRYALRIGYRWKGRVYT